MDKKKIIIIVSVVVALVIVGALGFYIYSDSINQETTTENTDENNLPEVIEYEDTATDKKEENMLKAEPDLDQGTPEVEGTLPEGSVVVPPPKL